MSNNKDGASKESRGMYGFDPSGLERAAAAAKILDSSPNSKNAFEIALKEEEVKLTKEKRHIK
jgi:ATPase family AAA domain-containing protein 3A/B